MKSKKKKAEINEKEVNIFIDRFAEIAIMQIEQEALQQQDFKKEKNKK